MSFEPWQKILLKTMILKPEIVRQNTIRIPRKSGKSQMELKHMMERSVPFAEKQSTTSEDVTNVPTADGANASDIYRLNTISNKFTPKDGIIRMPYILTRKEFEAIFEHNKENK